MHVSDPTFSKKIFFCPDWHPNNSPSRNPLYITAAILKYWTTYDREDYFRASLLATSTHFLLDNFETPYNAFDRAQKQGFPSTVPSLLFMVWWLRLWWRPLGWFGCCLQPLGLLDFGSPCYTPARQENLKMNLDWLDCTDCTWQLGYKTGDPCFHFLQTEAGTHSLIIDFRFCVDRKVIFNMLHIKLSTLFIFTAAIIAPIVALPVPGPPSPKPADSNNPWVHIQWSPLTFICP